MRQRNTAPLLLLLALIGIVAGTASCARMGQPDGGWYDETPPRVVATNPTDGATGVKAKRVEIVFDEYIKLENATEKVVVSPPQLEAPEIKSTGRRIVVSLNDTPIYDLSGRRILTPQPNGIYVKQGKKFVAK